VGDQGVTRRLVLRNALAVMEEHDNLRPLPSLRPGHRPTSRDGQEASATLARRRQRTLRTSFFQTSSRVEGARDVARQDQTARWPRCLCVDTLKMEGSSTSTSLNDVYPAGEPQFDPWFE